MTDKTFIAVAVFLGVLFGSVISVVAELGRFSTALEMSYGQHTATEKGSKVLDASHFTQKYSFLWSKEGALLNNRLGKYDVALGYEFSWVDSYRDNHVKVDIDNPLDKILYRGNVVIAPGGLPFQLKLYSYDLQSTSFVVNDFTELFSSPSRNRTGGTVTDINNGTRKVTGATLQAGVANGHYEGQYRDLLVKVPRLLIDYRQIDVKDTKGLSKQDYINRDLAFVSINKKKNWFHYRVFDHQNRLDGTQDYRDVTYLLGTIDHTSRRQWVNLTNWIQVSTDLSYNEHNPVVSTSGKGTEKRYSLNLFGKAERVRWSGSSFASFNRLRASSSLARDLFVPLYVSGELDRNTSWRFRFIGNMNEEEDLVLNQLEKVGVLFASGRVETFKNSRYIASPMVEAELKEGTRGEGYAGRIGMELYSNSSYRAPENILLNIESSYFGGTSETGEDVGFFEAFVNGKYERRLRSDLTAGFDQKLNIGTGSIDGTVSENIIARSAMTLDSQGPLFDGTLFRSLSNVYVDHRTLVTGIENHFEVTLDAVSGGNADGLRTYLGHSLTIRKGRWYLSMQNSAETGDVLSSATISSVSGADTSVSSSTRFDYTPSRALKTSVRFDFDWGDFPTTSTQRYLFSQISEYSFWQSGGVLRKLAVIGEEFEWQENEDSIIGDFTALTLFTDYYPTLRSLLGARLRYEMGNSDNTDTLTYFLTAGLNFQKLQVSLDYSYGTRTAGSSLPERKEQRWEIKVAKQF